MVGRGQKPDTVLIAAAREARYDLLAEAARDFSTDIVVTAHTMDDQAETVAMRAARGEGAGLAGMAAETLFDGRIWIARPLLGVRRQALRAFLDARGIAWIDDPTNSDDAYERVRVRAGLSNADVERLAEGATAEGEVRTALSARAARLVDLFAARPAPGLFRLDPELFRDRDAAPALHVLRAVLAVAGGAPHLPDRARAQALLARLGAGPLRATLSRAVVDARRSGIWIRREARGVPISPLAVPGIVWDGRWRIAATGEAHGLAVGPLGPGLAKALAPAHTGAPESLVRAALALEPALFRGDVFIVPAVGDDAARAGLTAHSVAAPFVRFLPGFDLPLAAALLRIVGAPPLPEPPWKHHIEAGA
jgi:tRNA(Ile)-lysidine synthase